MADDQDKRLWRPKATAPRELLARIQGLVKQGRETVEALGRRILGRVAPEPAATPPDPGEPPRSAAARSGVASRGLAPLSGELAPETLAQVDRDLPDLPSGYGDGRVVLLPRDPGWLYAYWDLAEERRALLRERGGTPTLRLHDVTDLEFDGQNSWQVLRQPVDEEATSCYLPVPVQGRHYLVELGYALADGSFAVLGRSEMVAAPPAGPSARVHDVYATLPPDEPLPRPGPAVTGVPSQTPGELRPAASWPPFGVSSPGSSLIR